MSFSTFYMLSYCFIVLSLAVLTDLHWAWVALFGIVGATWAARRYDAYEPPSS